MVAGQHVDVLIVGAGLSGIGAAYRIRSQSPGRTYAVLEARESIGGTWDLFRYPGIRSDSDMFTLSYPFRPWTESASIAPGESILRYIRETAAEHHIDEEIRFGHRVVRASWSTDDALWTVEATTEAGPATFTCSFLYMCSGYYSYAGGHAVAFPGQERFAGTVVHPQEWPADLDYAGKTVVVIGSGATAVTLVPSMADDAARVTMLQRSPSYVVSQPGTDPLADRVRSLLPPGVAHQVLRTKNVLMTTAFYQACRRWPKLLGAVLRKRVAGALPADVPADPHFVPSYDPWDQRLCVVPDGDLFRAMRRGKAHVVTDRIASFTERGIALESGRELEADIIVTATGLKMVTFGQMEISVDGRTVEPGSLYVYKGMMFGGVPNLAWCIGYINNSWTLRADLVSQYVARLLNHMAARGFTTCTPVIDDADPARSQPRPFLDLTSGYVQRVIDKLPKQGSARPWLARQNYLLDVVDMKLRRLDDPAMRFGRATRRRDVPAAAERLAVAP
jgi:cation diffusion facilitator CzcD-associated flavoprotein CzcO